LIPSDTGRLIDDIKPTIAVENLDQQIAEVIDHVTMRESEVQDRDGHWYRLQIRPYVTVDKKIDGAVVSLIDVDALKRALGAAEWARDAAVATVEAVPMPLIVLDDQLRAISANAAFCEGFQATKTSLEGRHVFDLMGGVWDIPDLRSALDRVVKTHDPVHRLPLVLDGPPLGPRSIAASARSLPVAGGTLVLLALKDTTERTRGDHERARLLVEAEAATARADEANRAKDLFLATLSHELRTPLSTLRLQAQLMRTAKMDEPRLRRAADAIERATLAQAQLIDDLLDISRITAGKLKIERESVELSSVVQAAVETVRPSAERKQLAIDVRADSLPPVSADPGRLQQVVLNLLTNAIKFTPAGGRIGVSIDAIDGRARLRVTDTGIGIEPGFVPHLFDRFAQEDRSQTRAHGGLGLGLAIVRYLVEAHGGTITAESAGKDRGATFTILLPLAESRPAPAPREEPTPAAHRGLAAIRVLLVEDDPGTREAMTEMLGLEGARVVAAESAAQAMSAFAGLRPELLVCDIAMPGEDGYSLLRRIRALGAARGGDVPALALTALASEDDRRHALDAGFQVHMAKPVDFARLVATLMRLLPTT
jgi:two-component system CheB/CheR fusion protein